MDTRRNAIERTLIKIGMLAIATTLFVFPTAIHGAQTTHAVEGFSVQTLSSVTAGESGAQLVVMRLVLEPGVTLPNHHHPGAASYTVISGVLQTTLLQGGASVYRGVEPVPAEIGDMMNLAAGLSISYSPHAIKSMANRTSKPLVLMASLLLEPNESMIEYEAWSPLFQLDLQ